MGSNAAGSPRLTARMAGFLYLLYCVLAGVAMFARRGLLVGGDAAATATNIMAHRSLYQLGFACDTLGIASYVATVALFYELLKPVNTNVSTVAAFFGLMGCVVQGFAGVFQLAPLVLLGGGSYLGAFNAEQLHAQAYFFLKLYTQGYCIALVCFGFFDLAVGYLILKSTFLPRILGLLMMLAGLAIMPFLVPAFGARYLAWIMPFAVGELLVILWLLVKGVNAERWIELATAGATSRR
jgi:Domain of unknown function (DUF4386)